MRKRSQRIKPLHRLALNKEQVAARDLGTSLRGVEQCRVQLRQLYQYREDYRQQFNRQASNGINGDFLRQYEAFMKQLDQAISEQQRQLALMEKECQQTKQHWCERRTRSKVLEKVMGRFINEEHHHQARAEQRETDDINNSRKK